MRAFKGPGDVKILSVSPLEEDHAALRAIAGQFAWELFQADGLPAALGFLTQQDVSVVICEHDLAPGMWTDLLERIIDLPHPPSLVVTSRLADEQLWAEALNRGAWDVLAKPFDRTEVLRVVSAAWQHWHGRIHLPIALKVMKVAS